MIPKEIITRSKDLYSNNRIGLLRKFEGLEAIDRIGKQFAKIFRTARFPAVAIKFLYCDDLLEVLKDRKMRIQDHHSIGDMSWQIEIAIDPKIKHGLDWDEKLGAKYGVVPILKYVINHYVGCYSSWCYTMAFDKKTKIYEFTPIELPKKLIAFQRSIEKALKGLNLVRIAKKDFETKIPNVTTDTIHKGPVEFFDLVFTDVYGHEFEKSRFTGSAIKIDSNFREFTGPKRHYYEESVTLNNGDRLFLVKETGRKNRITLTYTDRKGREQKKTITL